MTEQIYFLISDDGRHWSQLREGKPVLVSNVGERGVRDPFLLRAHDGNRFYLLATGLSMNRDPDWSRASRQGSKSLVIWESTDLINWSEPRLVKVAPDDAGCTWAPEAIFDDRTGDYLVFWASPTARDHFAKSRIWAARTKDFKTFGEPFIYIDRPHTVIDTDIVRDGAIYYRFTKDEEHSSVIMEKCDQLMGQWQTVPGFTLGRLQGYEGPECFRLSSGSPGQAETWCLVMDHFSKGAGYEPFVTNDLPSGHFTPATDFVFPFRLRHGAVLSVSADELVTLKHVDGKHEP